MIHKQKLCFLFHTFLLTFLLWGSGTTTHAQMPPTQYDPYAANHRSWSQLPQPLWFEARSNDLPSTYPNQVFNPLIATSHSSSSGSNYDNVEQRQFQQYPIPMTARVTTTPTQLWSGPPIVVGDDYYSGIGNDQALGNPPPLRPMHRTPKNLPVYNRREHPQSQLQTQPLPDNHRPMQLLQPSDFNYGNQVIYHSDVRRHQITTAPTDDAIRQQDFRIYPNYSNEQQQHHQQPENLHTNAHEPQQLHASNTDLNYLRALAGSNRKENPLAGGEQQNDYNEYFKAYLRKYPRRIKPIY